MLGKYIAMSSNGTPHTSFANLTNRWQVSWTYFYDVEFGSLGCSIPEILLIYIFQYHMLKFNQLKDVKCNVTFFN
jgi:hypothetical protein